MPFPKTINVSPVIKYLFSQVVNTLAFEPRRVRGEKTLLHRRGNSFRDLSLHRSSQDQFTVLDLLEISLDLGRLMLTDLEDTICF